jgi:hypothetical protein
MSSLQMLFWLIAVGANAPWSIFPTILLVQSFRAVMASFSKSATMRQHDE